jgi:hypothetical protein
MNSPADAAVDPAADVLAMINGAWVTQVIRTACVLDLPEHLARGPLGTAALAAAAGCPVDALERLLRAMAALKLCEAADGLHWQLTTQGACLRRDAARSLHHWALHAGGGLWQRLSDLPGAVRTGGSWPRRHHRVGGYARLAADPAGQAVFHHAMVELTRLAAPSLIPLLGLEGVRHVVDVGGGQGELLGAVLAAAPHAQGVLHDQPAALEGAAAVLARAGVAARCRIHGGDFFTWVPDGGDLYLLKSVLHNWDDASCVRLLGRCREAMTEGARIAVIERARPERPGHATRDREVARTDLNMLVSMSGRERHVGDYRRLMDAAGLALQSVRDGATEWSVLEARAVA